VNNNVSADLKAALLSSAQLIGGGFYTCPLPGGFAEVTSGLLFGGCKAIVDPVTRTVVELVEPSPPTQIPHFRMADFSSLNDAAQRQYGSQLKPEAGKRNLVRIPFAELTRDEFTLGLLLAIRTGTIKHVSDNEMQTLWPDVWANRPKSETTHGRTTNDALIDPEFATMFEKLMSIRQTTLGAEAKARATNGDNEPPAPPAPPIRGAK